MHIWENFRKVDVILTGTQAPMHGVKVVLSEQRFEKLYFQVLRYKIREFSMSK